MDGFQIDDEEILQCEEINKSVLVLKHNDSKEDHTVKKDEGNSTLKEIVNKENKKMDIDPLVQSKESRFF